GSRERCDLLSFPTRRSSDLSALWEPGLDSAPLCEQLGACADDGDGSALLQQLTGLVQGSRLRRLDETGRRRLKALLELLLEDNRSEEHTSELQSRENLVCRL